MAERMEFDVERFEFEQDADEAAELSDTGPWVRYADYRDELERLYLDRENAREGEDEFKASREAARRERDALLQAIRVEHRAKAAIGGGACHCKWCIWQNAEADAK